MVSDDFDSAGMGGGVKMTDCPQALTASTIARAPQAADRSLADGLSKWFRSFFCMVIFLCSVFFIDGDARGVVKPLGILRGWHPLFQGIFQSLAQAANCDAGGEQF